MRSLSFKNRFRSVLALTLAASSALFLPATASALNRDQRAIAVGGLYGVLGGTAMGLVALPTTRSGKSVLIGSSIGLYLGLVMAVYHIHHRDDPENPLRTELPEPRLASSLGPLDVPLDAPLRVEFTVHRF